MKQVIKIFLFLLFLANASKAQQLYYQGTYKGGASFDGREYYATNWVFPDTINFRNSVPTSCTLKKAFLISFRITCVGVSLPARDTAINLSYNNRNIQFDSNDVATPAFVTSVIPVGAFCWMSVKDVTSLTQNNGNKLITPSQVNNTCKHYQYSGFYLLLLYENSSYSTVNMALYLNNMNYDTTMNHVFYNLNPVNIANDVGLSIETTNDDLPPFLKYQLTSSTNTVTLGTLRQVNAVGNPINDLGLGSFYYQNGTLFGLTDDSPDAFIDSTDALANIKTYLPNNATSFSLTATNPPNASSRNMINAYVLAYSTPCPDLPHGTDSTKIYKFCGLQSTHLNATAGYSTYSWYPANGLSNTNIANPVATPSNTTNYVCTIKDNAGCMHTEYATVAIHKLPPKPDTIAKTDAICSDVGSIVITSNHNHYGYTYSLNGGASQSDTVFNNLSNGNYTLTTTDNFNCVYTSTLTIAEINLAATNFTSTQSVACVGEPTNFTNLSTNTNHQWWYFGLNDTSNVFSPSFIFTDTGYHSITLIGWRNLRKCSDTTVKTIYVKECPPDSITIVAPNIFSPNGDDINETWLPLIYQLGFTINDFNIMIYDRWGLKVFESSKTQQGWDGHTTSGLACNEGTYYYVVSYKASSANGKEKYETLKGFLQLIR